MLMKYLYIRISDALKDIAVDPDISALYLYGSALTGKLRQDSDIDVAVLPSLNIKDDDVFALIAKAEDVVSRAARRIGLKQEVSVLNLQDKSGSVILKFNAAHKGKLIYAKEEDVFYRRNFENALMGEYFDFKPYHERALRRKYGR
jgi:predicted nucleotidyltransferase